MEKCFGNYFLGKSQIFMKHKRECFRNEFRNYFWLECKSDSVNSALSLRKKPMNEGLKSLRKRHVNGDK